MIRLLTPGALAVTTICVGLDVSESTANGLLTYTRLSRVRLLMKIERPTTRCTSWLADLVELLSVVVASGNAVICAARTEAAAGTVAAGIAGGACACPTPKSMPQGHARYVPLMKPFIRLHLRASVNTLQ